jgi:two-component system, cell cycle sensor histidine kinase and response regulator CckA
MEPLALLVPLGPVVVLGFFYLRRIAEGYGAAQWAWAWAALFGAGALQSVGGGAPAIALANVCGALFMPFTLAGAIAYRGGTPPRWLVPAGAVFGLARAAFVLGGRPDLSYLIAAPYELALGSAAYMEVSRAGSDVPREPSTRLLGPALFGLAALDVVDVMLRWRGDSLEWAVPVWIMAGFAVVLIQIVAVVDRLRLRERGVRREREQLAGTLAEEQRTLRAVLESAPIGVFLLDRQWRITMANRLGIAQFELGSPEEWAGVSQARPAFIDRLENSAAFVAAFRAALDDPRAVIESVEARFRPPDARVVSISSTPVLSERSELLGRVFTSRDITSERRLEGELRQAQKMETLGTLAGGIAHDFNNQLTAILGNCRFVEGSIPPDHEAAAALRELSEAAEHCAGLTRSLLAFARRTPAEPGASDVARVAREVERMLRATLPARIACEVAIAPGLPPALVESTQLQQVLLNLCLNARDAIPGDGRIAITAEPCALGADEAAAHAIPPGDYVELRVRDDGTGMDEWTRARVFDPFFTTKPVGTGTGLGLAVVYGLVHSNGGWIGVESGPVRGTTFRVLLRIAPSTPAPAAEDLAAEDAGGGRGELVLVAEDEPAVRRVACGALRRAGFAVLEATDGAEALERLRERGSEVRLAVLDLSMPRVDGLTALADMRRVLPGLRILLVSGRFPAELTSPPPGVELLPKPFEPRTLAARVRTLLDRP